MASRGHNRSTKQSIALLIIDVINDMEFEEGKQLFKQALPMARKIAALKSRASSAQVPIIYVNDNFGHWRSDLKKQIFHCLMDGVRGEPIARLLVPDHSDYFVLKPKSSAFFGTTLHITAIPWCKDSGINGHCSRRLHPLYSARRAFARLRDYYSFRLRGFQHLAGDAKGAGQYEESCACCNLQIRGR
jgi:isochorismate hydrolase